MGRGRGGERGRETTATSFNLFPPFLNITFRVRYKCNKLDGLPLLKFTCQTCYALIEFNVGYYIFAFGVYI